MVRWDAEEVKFFFYHDDQKGDEEVGENTDDHKMSLVFQFNHITPVTVLNNIHIVVIISPFGLVKA